MRRPTGRRSLDSETSVSLSQYFEFSGQEPRDEPSTIPKVFGGALRLDAKGRDTSLEGARGEGQVWGEGTKQTQETYQAPHPAPSERGNSRRPPGPHAPRRRTVGLHLKRLLKSFKRGDRTDWRCTGGS